MTSTPWALVALSLSLAACSPPPAPVAAPRKRSTLAVQTSFVPAFHWRFWVDGAPLEGTVSLGCDPAGERPPGRATLSVVAGRATPDQAALEALSPCESLTLRHGDDEHPLPRTGTRSPHACAQLIAAIPAHPRCDDPLHVPDEAAARCDHDGSEALAHTLDDAHASQDARCFADLTPATIERVASLPYPAHRYHACKRLHSLATSREALRQLAPLADPCAGALPPDAQAELARAALEVALPGAFEAARQGSSADLKAFVERFRATGDPRVDEARRLALARFGPADPVRFVATTRKVEALSTRVYRARLCNATKSSAQLAVWTTRAHILPVAAGDGLDVVHAIAHEDRSSPELIAHPTGDSQLDALRARATRLVRRELGVQNVELVDRCTVDHWYLRM